MILKSSRREVKEVVKEEVKGSYSVAREHRASTGTRTVKTLYLSRKMAACLTHDTEKAVAPATTGESTNLQPLFQPPCPSRRTRSTVHLATMPELEGGPLAPVPDVPPPLMLPPSASLRLPPARGSDRRSAPCSGSLCPCGLILYLDISALQ